MRMSRVKSWNLVVITYLYRFLLYRNPAASSFLSSLYQNTTLPCNSESFFICSHRGSIDYFFICSVLTEVQLMKFPETDKLKKNTDIRESVGSFSEDARCVLHQPIPATSFTSSAQRPIVHTFCSLLFQR